MKKLGPNLDYERRMQGVVAGVDEAGRGPWAGPVLAAAVVLNPAQIPEGLNDSKKLSAKQRAHLYQALCACADIGLGAASVAEIDRYNIRQATHRAMIRALKALPQYPDTVLVDGHDAPVLPCTTHTLIGGDSLSLSIAAASIVAKVTRDRLMSQLARRHPGYAWERNKGYGTRDHQEALAHRGVCAHHRLSFAPIQRALELQSASNIGCFKSHSSTY